jgi:hypothetical protein
VRRTWPDSLDNRPKQRKMDMRFGTWNVRSMYRAGSLRTVAEEEENEMGRACSTNGGDEESV